MTKRYFAIHPVTGEKHRFASLAMVWSFAEKHNVSVGIVSRRKVY